MQPHASSRTATVLLAARSLFWFVAFPGLFAGVLPWVYFGVGRVAPDAANPAHLIGLLSIGAGTLVLIACVWEFARSGRGTLSPVDPPRRLVVRGPYRYVRNPMYLSINLVVLGEVLLTGSTGLVLYWIVWLGAATMFVVLHEEPFLARQFGNDYSQYRRAVPRWRPRMTPYRSEQA